VKETAFRFAWGVWMNVSFRTTDFGGGGAIPPRKPFLRRDPGKEAGVKSTYGGLYGN